MLGLQVLVVVLVVVAQAAPQNWEQMGVPAYVDGDAATGAPTGPSMAVVAASEYAEPLQVGPMVNGGDAEPATPVVGKNHGNGDCIGRMKDGRCVRFPTTARPAQVVDNMASPEQQAPSKYEADIHLFVKKHFGQKVMMDSPQDLLHPSDGVTASAAKRIMNTESNEFPDEMAKALLPLGTGMMTSGDMEMPAVMTDDGMYAADPALMKATVQAIKDVASAEGVVPGDAVTEAVQPKLADKSTSALPGGVVSDALLNDVLENTRPLAPLEIEEKAPPQTEDISPEPELPPTPTPTPTVDPAIAEAAAAAAAAKQAQMKQCIDYLGTNDIFCSGNSPEDRVLMKTKDNREKEEQTATGVMDMPYDPANIRANYQALVIQCTQEAAAGITNVTFATTEMRTQFAAKLEKYSKAMLCLDHNFPDCITPAVKNIITQDPKMADDGSPRDKWPCW